MGLGFGKAQKERTKTCGARWIDAAGDFRDTIAAAIDQALRDNGALHRVRPLSTYGGMAMTLYVWSPPAPRRSSQAVEHARAVMLAGNETSRRLVELEYSEQGVLAGAHLTHVRTEGLGQAELERARAAGQALQHRRLERARAAGKIGRNDLCPCGSGKKFKRCHGRSVWCQHATTAGKPRRPFRRRNPSVGLWLLSPFTPGHDDRSRNGDTVQVGHLFRHRNDQTRRHSAPDSMAAFIVSVF